MGVFFNWEWVGVARFLWSGCGLECGWSCVAIVLLCCSGARVRRWSHSSNEGSQGRSPSDSPVPDNER